MLLSPSLLLLFEDESLSFFCFIFPTTAVRSRQKLTKSKPEQGVAAHTRDLST